MTTPEELQQALSFLDEDPPVVLNVLLAKIEALEARVAALEPNVKRSKNSNVDINVYPSERARGYGIARETMLRDIAEY